jgi:hypothetical protein
LSFDATLKMNGLNQGKSFDEKSWSFGFIVSERGFRYAHLMLKKLKVELQNWNSLFRKDKEVHARLIWVEGVEVCSHLDS